MLARAGRRWGRAATAVTARAGGGRERERRGVPEPYAAAVERLERFNAHEMADERLGAARGGNGDR